MSNQKLNVGSVLNRAFLMPFRMDASSWTVLAKPISGIVMLGLLAYLAGQKPSASLVTDATGFLLILTFAWFAYTLLRECLRSTNILTVPPSTGVSLFQFILGAAVVLAVFALAASVVFYAALPLTLYFAFSVSGETPILAFGAIGMYGLSMLVGAYPAARIVSALPALSIGNVAEAKEAWSITSGNGIRLLIVHGIPIAVQVYVEYVLVFSNPSLTKLLAAILITSLLFFVQVAAIACIYIDLYRGETIEHGVDDGTSTPGWTAATGMFAIVAVSTLIGFAGSPAKPDMTDSSNEFVGDPGNGPFVTTFESAFLTNSKEMVTIVATTEWDVADEERFKLATGGSVRHANMRINEIAKTVVRNSVAKQKFEDFGPVFDTPADAVLRQTNDYSRELGVHVSRIAIQPPADQ